jgi:hypothetical protein
VGPHQYLKVNTVFEVARAAGLRTAWSDKHAPYEIFNGPSGTGIQDLFTLEINSARVETTQIAPTILRLLGLNPNALKAVQIEQTRALPLSD